MSKHYPPVFLEEQFHCPHCNVYASQLWSRLIPKSNASRELEVRIAFCNHCDGYTIWKQEVMVFPDGGAAAMPHDDMPANVKEDYLEARAIVNKSPKGAAALLRLALQRLMRHLGKSGENTNNDIADLVKEGLPPMVQQACDAVRVIGNESVHPGEIDLRDTPEIAHTLFDLLNIIVEDRITRPKSVLELYKSLPPGKLQGIENRDKTGGT